MLKYINYLRLISMTLGGVYLNILSCVLLTLRLALGRAFFMVKKSKEDLVVAMSATNRISSGIYDSRAFV